jgi:hypothetical protein
LHREVNISRISPAAWDGGEDAFVQTLTSRPLVPIAISGDGRDPEEGAR